MMNGAKIIVSVALVLLCLSEARHAVAADAKPYPPEPPDVPIPELPELPLEQWLQEIMLIDLHPFVPAERTFYLAGKRLQADTDGPEKHVLSGECLIIQEIFPHFKKRYLVRPVSTCAQGALQPGFYIAKQQANANRYKLSKMWIKTTPKHPSADEHDIEIFVQSRDSSNRDLPDDIMLHIETDHGVGSGGGSHPGHVRFR